MPADAAPLPPADPPAEVKPWMRLCAEYFLGTPDRDNLSVDGVAECIAAYADVAARPAPAASPAQEAEEIEALNRSIVSRVEHALDLDHVDRDHVMEVVGEAFREARVRRLRAPEQREGDAAPDFCMAPTPHPVTGDPVPCPNYAPCPLHDATASPQVGAQEDGLLRDAVEVVAKEISVAAMLAAIAGNLKQRDAFNGWADALRATRQAGEPQPRAAGAGEG